MINLVKVGFVFLFAFNAYSDINLGLNVTFKKELSDKNRNNIHKNLKTYLLESKGEKHFLIPNDHKLLMDGVMLEQICIKYRAYDGVGSCEVIKSSDTCCLGKKELEYGDMSFGKAVKELKTIGVKILESFEFEDIVEKNPGQKCQRKRVAIKENTHTENSAEFKLEMVLKPGECIYLEVPEKLRKGALDQIVLGHRQDPSTEKGWNKSKEGWDDIPALTSVHLHTSDYKNPEEQWRYWGGMSSGKNGAKFAAVSHAPEIDRLYQFADKGHYSVGGYTKSKDPLFIDAIKISSVGEDQVIVNSLAIHVVPKKAENLQTYTFTPGLEFGDLANGKGRNFGEKKEYYGKYPGALALGYRSDHIQPSLPSGWKVKDQDLTIPIKPGKTIKTIELAVGDQHSNVEEQNSDGGWGTSGWAKLSYGIKKKSGEIVWFENYQGVPPQGFFRGTPPNGFKTENGDEIIIRAQRDTMMIMGVRLGLGKME